MFGGWGKREDEEDEGKVTPKMNKPNKIKYKAKLLLSNSNCFL